MTWSNYLILGLFEKEKNVADNGLNEKHHAHLEVMKMSKMLLKMTRPRNLWLVEECFQTTLLNSLPLVRSMSLSLSLSLIHVMELDFLAWVCNLEDIFVAGKSSYRTLKKRRPWKSHPQRGKSPEAMGEGPLPFILMEEWFILGSCSLEIEINIYFSFNYYCRPDPVILKDIPPPPCLQDALEFLKKKKMHVSRSTSVLNNSNQAFRLLSTSGLLSKKWGARMLAYWGLMLFLHLSTLTCNINAIFALPLLHQKHMVVHDQHILWV